MTDTATPSPYSPTIPHFQLAWDSTSLGAFKTCGEYYRLTQLEGWTTRTRSIDLVFGGAYASSLEHYAHALASGLDIQAATRVAVRHALSTTWGADFPDPDTGEPGPWIGDNIKNRATLVRSVIWNIEAFRDSPFHIHLDTLGKPMVERTFNFAFTELGGELITLNGHLDAVLEEDTSGEPRLWVMDDKTTRNSLGASYFERFTPDNQMSLYSIAGRIVLNRPVAGVMVRAAQVGVNFTRFEQRPILRTQAVLEEWLEDAKHYITLARQYAEQDRWPHNDKSCFLCAFKRVCGVAPAHRKGTLMMDFEQRVERWNPLAARGL